MTVSAAGNFESFIGSLWQWCNRWSIHWWQLALCVPTNALTLMAGWQEGHLAYKKPSISLMKQLEEEDLQREPADPGLCGKWPLNRSSTR